MALPTVQGNAGFAFDIQSMSTIFFGKFSPNFKLRRGNGINFNISQVNSGSPEYIPDKDFGDKTSTNVTKVQQENSDCEVSDCKDFGDKTSTNVTTVQQETSDCEVSDCKANKTMSSVINGHGKLSNETHSLNMKGKIEAQVPKETTQCEDFAFKASITMSKVANGHGKSSVETHNPSPSTEEMIEVKFPQQASLCEDPVFNVKANAAPSDTKIPEDEKCTIKDSTLRKLPKEKCTLPCKENINELKTGFPPRRLYSIDEKQKKYYSKTKSHFMLKKQHHFKFSVVLCILIISGIRLAAAESGCSTPDPFKGHHGNSVKILCIFEENINPSNGGISLWHINTSGIKRKVMAYFSKNDNYNFASPDYKIVDNGPKEVGVYISAFSKEHEGKYECSRAGLVNVTPSCPSNLIFLDYTSTNGPNNVSSNILKMTYNEVMFLFLFLFLVHLLWRYYWGF